MHEAEGLLHPVSKAMRGVMPETLQWYFDYKKIKKEVPIGKPSLGDFMKREVTEAVATEVAEVKYFLPNGIDTLNYAEVGGLLLGIVYHLPSLATSCVGGALTRLGSPKQVYKDFEVKERIRQSRLDQAWLAELAAYERARGIVSVFNALHGAIRELYEERGDLAEITNRLERVWPRFEDGCADAPTSAGGQPQRMGIWAGQGTVIDNDQGSCEPPPMGLGTTTVLGAKLRGFVADLAGIRHVRAERGVIWPFMVAVGILLAIGAGGWFGWRWWKSRN